MIKTVFSFGKQDGFLKRFEARGHANGGEKGKDPVCAGFSVLCRAAVRYLEQTDALEAAQTAEGFLDFRLKTQAANKTAAALEMFALGIKDLETDFPNHIKVTVKRI